MVSEDMERWYERYERFDMMLRSKYLLKIKTSKEN